VVSLPESLGMTNGKAAAAAAAAFESRRIVVSVCSSTACVAGFSELLLCLDSGERLYDVVLPSHCWHLAYSRMMETDGAEERLLCPKCRSKTRLRFCRRHSALL